MIFHQKVFKMIPKIIHFTWFSNDPFPDIIKGCIDSWGKKLKGYEIIHWDMEKIKDIDNPFLREALNVRKWAFAADFVRLYALYNYGGIYLDTDVEVYKDFNLLLEHKAFIGRENSYHMDGRKMLSHLTSHCMGSEKGHPYFKLCLDYYKGRHFILSPESWLPDNLKYDQKTLPYIQTEMAVMQGYRPSRKIKGVQIFGDDVHVYPYEYFDCFYRKANTYCKHLAMGGWRTNYEKDNLRGLKDYMKRRGADILYNLSGTLGFTLVKDDKR